MFTSNLLLYRALGLYFRFARGLYFYARKAIFYTCKIVFGYEKLLLCMAETSFIRGKINFWRARAGFYSQEIFLRIKKLLFSTAKLGMQAEGKALCKDIKLCAANI